MGRRQRDERGLVLPTRLMVFSISLVALAGLIYFATRGPDTSGGVAAPAGTETPSATATVGAEPTPTDSAAPDATPSPSPTSAASPTPTRTPLAERVDRGGVYVEVYNNSNVAGLAGRTGEKVTAAGWKLVGTDNWYGTVDATTIYYGPGLRDAARLLAQDLGISVMKKAVQPMRFDRLTVILTAAYAS